MAGWLLLRNEDAGSDDAEVVESVARTLRDDGPAEVVATGDADDLDEALRKAGGRTVVLCGGDGSVQLGVERARALGLLDELTFGIVPLGTGNDLAGHLGVPDDADGAAATLLTAAPRPLDLLVTGEDRVVVNAVHVGIGVDAAERAGDLKGALGALAYPLGAVIAGVVDDGLDLEVVVDGRRVDRGAPALLAAVGNGSTIGGGHALLPDAREDDGLLDVVVVHAVGRPARVAFAADLLRGTHLDRDDVVTARGREVVVRGTDLSQNRDGELEPTTAHLRRYRVEPGAWRARVPVA